MAPTWVSLRGYWVGPFLRSRDPDGVRARSLTVSLGDERRSGSMNDLALALVFVLAVALLIAAIYVAVTS